MPPRGRKAHGMQDTAGRNKAHREGRKEKRPTPPLWEGRRCLSAPLKFAPCFCHNFLYATQSCKIVELVSKITRGRGNAVKKMLKNGVFWAEWERRGWNEGHLCPRRACVKRADLRAFDWSVEGLYPLEGEVRNMGISEGFTGK